MLAGLLLLLAVASPQLRNPRFEAAAPVPGQVPGWKVSIESKGGSGVVVKADSTQFKEGRKSLLVEAHDPSDVTVSQELFLPVGSLWKVSAWIRTEGLSGPDKTSKGAQIVVETPAGDQGRTLTQPGDSSWQEEQIVFRVPSPGRIRIALVGLAHAVGRVWFDGVQLQVVPETPAKDIRIDYARISKRPIDVKQGGQFIEPLTHLIPSMLAQQVESTSFEEEPPWKPSYKRAIDKPHRPWYPDGAVQDATFSPDSTNPYNGKLSERIDLPLARARAGISQDGFYLTKGLGYRLHLHMRSIGNVEVWASLGGGGGLIAGPVSLGRAGAGWQGAEAFLRANRTIRNATLTIEFQGPGTLWLDRVYLIGEDAVLGLWRPDVVSALKAMNPGVIRFGGSTMEVFEWEKCIGPWDNRVPYVTNPWGGLDPNFVGVEEFIQLCRYVNAEPLICVRWG
ncbi:MAG: hypothetical protein ACREP9_03360, partial [Candidatus Dormibacteraceae bacterium]